MEISDTPLVIDEIPFRAVQHNTIITYKNSSEPGKSNISNNTNLNNPSVDLGKLLLLACRDGDFQSCCELMTKGAPFASDWLGMSALHFAAQNDHFNICVKLLRGGHNCDVKTKVDRTPLHLAVYEGHDKVVELLCLKKANVNTKDMLLMTPLHWAIEKKHKKIVRILLENGATVDDVSKFGKTPFSLATETGQNELTAELTAASIALKEKELMNDEEIKNETSYAVDSIMKDNAANQTNYELNDELIRNEILEDMDNNQQTKIPSKIKVEEPNSTIEMLKKLKSMASSKEDLKDNLLSSALQNGRKLVLSEGGKLALDDTRKRQLSENNNMTKILKIKRPTISSEIVKKEQSSKPEQHILFSHKKLNEFKPFQKSNVQIISNERINNNNLSAGKQTFIIKQPQPINKNVKVISLNHFKKLCEGNIPQKQINFIENSSNVSSFPITSTCQVTNLNELNAKKSIFKHQKIKPPTAAKISETNICENIDDDESMSNIIEVMPDDEFENIDMSKTLIEMSSENNTIVPILDIPSICNELFELRQLTQNLQRELENTKKENQDYKKRIEKIERLITGR